jgi:hypothetical protein
VHVKAGLLDDRAHSLQRLRPLEGHRAPEHLHCPGVGRSQTEQRADDRGLARSVGAEEAERAAARHLQIDAVERRALTEALGQPMRLDRKLHGTQRLRHT